ncbi:MULTISPECIES: chemotaxis protein CheA [Marichromatium]|uniref:Chemotaxis protein CheA n=1 Tax=Marichromatium gracile TaxID=1048 RepID=A0A4R4A5C8_MARGR|nr:MULTISPECIES: chemotaxis protein CheA [Marichromatium]MBK1708131.1 chemotaxis protein CheA [Marichromatium gracile]RNE94712.1 chemotaxis protein CheA [Marichromatium sp. AB32]TCW33428.1 two-component system chemotaxis sensor kinase CheA [Marichromatium gracile]
MPIDPNDEILQDFLVEAGELLEGLNEQLIDLEQDPANRDLLNSVFRSFHTIKGGAGFLNLNALVSVCHHAEDVFNLLRNGERHVDAQLMDTVLRVLDVVNVMFGDLQSGKEPEPAAPELIAELEQLASPAAAAPEPPPAPVEPVPAEPEAAPEPPSESVAAGAEPADEITEQEFEALLDALSGQPQSGAAPAESVPPEPTASTSAEISAAGGPPVEEEPAGEDTDLITDEEFENLLDQLHGKGAFTAAPAPKAAAESAPSSPPPAPQPSTAPAPAKPAPKPEGESSAAAAAARAVKQAATPTETSVRVDTNRLDEIMNLVGELVLVRNRLSMLRSQTEDDEVSKAINSLALVTADLQSAVMKTRMQPIKKVFSRFPRVVRDLSRSLGKEIDFQTYGEETDLDKNLVEALADPLVHLIRNAVDHGIEMPDVREAAGKSRRGRVILGAAQEGDHIALTIEDDGRGMDPQALRLKAVEKGLLEPSMAERLSDRDAFNLIFMAGFSTKEEISDVSGRGVGMDVVKTRIAQLNGSVEIDSELGRGTLLQVKLPLTLAILPALMVILDGRRFAIPLASVSEILDLDLSRSRFVDEQEAIVVRSHALPIYHIGRWVRPGRDEGPRGEAHVVVVQVGQRKVGLVVDGLVGQEEVVIKPLGLGLRHVSGLAGATITGDGGIALILDVPELLKVMGRSEFGGRRETVAELATGS